MYGSVNIPIPRICHGVLENSLSVRIAEPGASEKTGTGRKRFQLTFVFGGVYRMGRVISQKCVLLNNFGFVAMVVS